MKAPLRHLATIQTGYFGKVSPHGLVVYIQPSNFDSNGDLLDPMEPELPVEGIGEKHFLQPGDVLFSAKGSNNFATCYTESEGKAVASTAFFVIRLHDTVILPEYMVWYLNHPKTLTYLKGYARGTSMPSISKAVLADLEIPIPPLEKQKTIEKIHDLQDRENKIRLKIMELRNQRIQQQLYNAANS